MSTANKCAVTHCPNMLKPAARVNTCQACRHSFRYAQQPDKGPSWVINRHTALLKYTDRMIMLARTQAAFRPAITSVKRELRKY